MKLNRRSFAPVLVMMEMGIISLMLSCASRPPVKRITVRMNSGFAGTIYLAACVSGSPATDISLNPQGQGSTSVCLARNDTVEIHVIRGNKDYVIGSESVTISRTGDGLATSIRAEVHP